MFQLPHQEGDVIMLVKQYMSSTALSQAPCILSPASYKDRLPTPAPTQVHPRNPLSERAVAEYMKTARAIAEHPWLLLEASGYLERWCQANLAAHHGTPPPLSFFVGPPRGVDVLPTPRDLLGGEWAAFAPGTPKRVTVKAEPPPKRRRVLRKSHPAGSVGPDLALQDDLGAEARPGADLVAGLGEPAAPDLAQGRGGRARGSRTVAACGRGRGRGRGNGPATVEALPSGPAAVPAELPAAKAQARRGGRRLTPLDRLGCGRCRFSSRGCVSCAKRYAEWQRQQSLDGAGAP